MLKRVSVILSIAFILALVGNCGRDLIVNRSAKLESQLEDFGEQLLSEIFEVKVTGLPRFSTIRRSHGSGDGMVIDVVFLLNKKQASEVKVKINEKMEQGWTKNKISGLSRPSVYYDKNFRGAIMYHAPEDTHFIVFESAILK